MGFSYCQGLLCCDFCGNYKPEYNVKKITCPYGYCQAWACCKVCKAKKKHMICSIGKTEKSHIEICKPMSQMFDKYGPGMFYQEETKQLCEALKI